MTEECHGVVFGAFEIRLFWFQVSSLPPDGVYETIHGSRYCFLPFFPPSLFLSVSLPLPSSLSIRTRSECFEGKEWEFRREGWVQVGLEELSP